MAVSWITDTIPRRILSERSVAGHDCDAPRQARVGYYGYSIGYLDEIFELP
jgi:hypothetical protein